MKIAHNLGVVVLFLKKKKGDLNNSKRSKAEDRNISIMI